MESVLVISQTEGFLCRGVWDSWWGSVLGLNRTYEIFRRRTKSGGKEGLKVILEGTSMGKEG